MTSEQFQNRVIPLSSRIFPMAARMPFRKQLIHHPNLEGFIFLTARNHCLDRLRRNIPEQPYTEYQERIPERSVDQHELKEVFTFIRSIIHELPENQKKAILFYDFDGLKFTEISEITGLKIEHIRVLLSRARKSVREKLAKIYSYEQGKTNSTP